MIKKISSYVMYALMGISVIVTILAFSDNYDPIIYSMYAFFIVSVALAVVLAVAGMIMNPKSMKATLFSLVGFAVLFGISYAISGSEVLSDYGAGTTESDSKLIGMAIITMYILFFGSIGAVVYSGVSKMLK